MKAAALCFLVLCTVSVWSQNTINNYKYVLVPERFAFARENNQYGLNNLLRMLLEDKGFTAYMSNTEMPPQVAANKCSALKAEVVEKKGLFVTNLTLLLKDCQDNIIFKSKEGKSREKEYYAAYNEALRDAFSSFKDVAYHFDSTALPQPQAVAVAAAPAPPTPTTPAITEATGTLYAQATSNGFQLIDTTPKKVLTLFKTSMPDYFIAQDGGLNGVVFKKNEEWLYEYYKDNKLVSLKLQIKF